MSISHIVGARHGAAAEARIRVASPANAPLHALAWVVACIARARQRRALARLDDRLLRDIGLTASNVADELAKPFWRD